MVLKFLIYKLKNQIVSFKKKLLCTTIECLFFFLDRNLELTLDTKLGYRNSGDNDDDWKLFASSVEKRNLDCVSEEVNNSCLYISF